MRCVPVAGKIDGRDSVLVALQFFILVKVTLVEFHPPRSPKAWKGFPWSLV